MQGNLTGLNLTGNFRLKEQSNESLVSLFGQDSHLKFGVSVVSTGRVDTMLVTVSKRKAFKSITLLKLSVKKNKGEKGLEHNLYELMLWEKVKFT